MPVCEYRIDGPGEQPIDGRGVRSGRRLAVHNLEQPERLKAREVADDVTFAHPAAVGDRGFRRLSLLGVQLGQREVGAPGRYEGTSVESFTKMAHDVQRHPQER